MKCAANLCVKAVVVVGIALGAMGVAHADTVKAINGMPLKVSTQNMAQAKMDFSKQSIGQIKDSIGLIDGVVKEDVIGSDVVKIGTYRNGADVVITSPDNVTVNGIQVHNALEVRGEVAKVALGDPNGPGGLYVPQATDKDVAQDSVKKVASGSKFSQQNHKTPTVKVAVNNRNITHSEIGDM